LQYEEIIVEIFQLENDMKTMMGYASKNSTEIRVIMGVDDLEADAPLCVDETVAVEHPLLDPGAVSMFGKTIFLI